MLERFTARLSLLRDWTIRQPYLGVLLRAAEKGQHNQSRDLAASIAYYAFLSLFPLLLGLISLGGFFLESEDVQLRVHELIVQVVPASADLVTRNIDTLVRIRGAAGLTSAVVLMWSASKMAGALSRAINRALGVKTRISVVFLSLRYIALTLAVIVLMFLNMAAAPIIELLSGLQLDLIGERWNAYLDVGAAWVTGLLPTALLVAVIYLLVPYQWLPLRKVMPGVAVAAVLIESGKSLFVWYVGTAANYSAMYGSVSSIIVLLLWLYFWARIVLFGAELISVNRS